MGMDRKIEKKTWTGKRIALLAGGAILLTFVIYNLLFADTRSKLNVDAEKITITTVKEGEFLEFIPVTGTVQPIETFYMDAIEGGIIQRVVRETGAMVEEGDTILLLSNSNLQLDVLNREAQLYEQINNLRNTRLLLDQNTMALKNQLAEINYQIQLLKPQFDRQKQLYESKAISRQEFEAIQEEYQYNLERKKLTYASYRQDSIMKKMQMSQLTDSEKRMWRSLDAVEMILDNLVVTAPVEGQYSSGELESGQSITIGQRLGQVDIVDSFKVRVRIDELYLPRIDFGQIGTLDFNSNNYRLKITKIYPTITDGRFEVDMEFDGVSPNGIKRGQSLRIRLELGNPGKALLVNTGGFYQNTGGNWIYLLKDDGEKAVKQSIRLGRKNPEYYEILEGLEPGDQVITSGYDNFGDNEVLVLEVGD
jgi:HlyD family secretion protein